MKTTFSRTYMAFQHGRYGDADDLLSEISLKGSVVPSVFLVRGVARLMTSDLHGSKAILERGLQVSKIHGDTRFEAAFCINLGQLYFDLAKPALSADLMENAIFLCKSGGFIKFLMVALRQQALLHLFMGCPEKGESLVRSGIEIAKTHCREEEISSFYFVLGTLQTATGDLKSAKQYLVQGTEAATSKKRGELSRAWLQIGLLELLFGNLEVARNAAVKSLEVAKEEGNKLSLARGISLTVTLEVVSGTRIPDAEVFDRAIEIERRSGYRYGIIRHRMILAKLCLLYQDFQSASTLCRTAASLADETGNEVSKIEICGLTALLSGKTTDEGHFKVLEDCIESCRKAGLPLQEVEMYQVLGSAYVGSGLYTEACQCFEEAAELSHRIGVRLEEAKALSRLAQAQELQGEKEKGLELASTAQAIIQSMGISSNSIPAA